MRRISHPPQKLAFLNISSPATTLPHFKVICFSGILVAMRVTVCCSSDNAWLSSVHGNCHKRAFSGVLHERSWIVSLDCSGVLANGGGS